MIIITGGAGFIGSYVIAELESQGYKDLVVVDWLGKGDKWKNIAKRELAAIVAPENIWEYMARYNDEIDAVVHMGAISITTEKDVEVIIQSNFELSWKLWEFCRDKKKQFIYASSASTYGDGSQGFIDDNSLAALNALRPLNPYGWSKALFDRKVAREIQEGRGAPKQYIGLKFFNVYGANEYHKGDQKSVIAQIFPQVKNNEEVKLFKSYSPKFKDGEQLRDFVWIGDVAAVILWMLKNPHVNGIYNVGTGVARSFYDLAKITWNAVGKEPKIGFKEMPEELKNKYQYYTQADLTNLRKAGFKQEMTSLEDGVMQYVQEFLMKNDCYK